MVFIFSPSWLLLLKLPIIISKRLQRDFVLCFFHVTLVFFIHHLIIAFRNVLMMLRARAVDVRAKPTHNIFWQHKKTITHRNVSSKIKRASKVMSGFVAGSFILIGCAIFWMKTSNAGPSFSLAALGGMLHLPCGVLGLVTLKSIIRTRTRNRAVVNNH